MLCSNWESNNDDKRPLWAPQLLLAIGCWLLPLFLSCEPGFKAQQCVVSDISTLLFDWYLWELSNVCILYTENAKLTSFCFVWQNLIKPSASHLPCLSGPSTAEPGKNFCLWFSEVSSQFPELSSWWRCARHLPKEFVASYSVLELGFRDFFC